MTRNLRVTVLVDNSASLPGMIAEHGLSMLIEADGKAILFDTGQGEAFLQNAHSLDCPLRSLDAIVLSHGHYDHTGGLASAIALGGKSPILMHPHVLKRRFSRGSNGKVRSIGIPPQALVAIERSRERIVWVRSPAEIVPGVWCTGEVPRLSDSGIDNSRFFLDEDGDTPDSILDDQAIWVETTKGIVVLAGCTHAGLENTLAAIAHAAADDRFIAVVGGLHLNGAPQFAWEHAANALAQKNVRFIGPCHCTGTDAFAYLRARFGDCVREVGAGTRISLADIV